MLDGDFQIPQMQILFAAANGNLGGCIRLVLDRFDRRLLVDRRMLFLGIYCGLAGKYLEFVRHLDVWNYSRLDWREGGRNGDQSEEGGVDRWEDVGDARLGMVDDLRLLLLLEADKPYEDEDYHPCGNLEEDHDACLYSLHVHYHVQIPSDSCEVHPD